MPSCRRRPAARASAARRCPPRSRAIDWATAWAAASPVDVVDDRGVSSVLAPSLLPGSPIAVAGGRRAPWSSAPPSRRCRWRWRRRPSPRRSTASGAVVVGAAVVAAASPRRRSSSRRPPVVVDPSVTVDAAGVVVVGDRAEDEEPGDHRDHGEHDAQRRADRRAGVADPRRRCRAHARSCGTRRRSGASVIMCALPVRVPSISVAVGAASSLEAADHERIVAHRSGMLEYLVQLGIVVVGAAAETRRISSSRLSSNCHQVRSKSSIARRWRVGRASARRARPRRPV